MQSLVHYSVYKLTSYDNTNLFSLVSTLKITALSFITFICKFQINIWFHIFLHVHSFCLNLVFLHTCRELDSSGDCVGLFLTCVVKFPITWVCYVQKTKFIECKQALMWTKLIFIEENWFNKRRVKHVIQYSNWGLSLRIFLRVMKSYIITSFIWNPQ